MDTSKEYISMCEKAGEIQGIRKYEDGNIEASNGDTSIICLDCDLEYGCRTEFTTETFWLPRQDQLQKMVEIVTSEDFAEKFVFQITGYRRNGFGDEVLDEWRKFGSMEQLWLAFVMKEKFNKVWNGEDWV